MGPLSRIGRCLSLALLFFGAPYLRDAIPFAVLLHQFDGLRTRTRRLYYNGELQGLAKAKRWELALSLLQSLPTKKVRPDKAGRVLPCGFGGLQVLDPEICVPSFVISGFLVRQVMKFCIYIPCIP